MKWMQLITLETSHLTESETVLCLVICSSCQKYLSLYCRP